MDQVSDHIVRGGVEHILTVQLPLGGVVLPDFAVNDQRPLRVVGTQSDFDFSTIFPSLDELRNFVSAA